MILTRPVKNNWADQIEIHFMCNDYGQFYVLCIIVKKLGPMYVNDLFVINENRSLTYIGPSFLTIIHNT